MPIKLIETIAVQNILGEGVIYDWRNNSILWTDIEGCNLYSYSLASSCLEQFPTSERLASFALTSHPHKLLCGFASGFALFQWQTGELQWLHQPSELKAGNGLRLNDGRLDPQGRFWCGSMVEDRSRCPIEKASLYCLDQNLQLHKKFSNIDISNGICWSPNNDSNQQQFYFSDSPKREMYRFSYDPQQGGIDNKQLFATTAKDHYPDGAVTDVQGYLWSAQWGAGNVVRFNRQGAIDLSLEVPVPQPSCVAFGGDSMNLLMVTSARQDLSSKQLDQFPDSGNLFIYNSEYQGIKEPFFKLPN